MRRSLAVLILLFLLGLTACSSSYRVVQLPLRDADLYPRAQTKGGVTIAVDEITEPQRVKSYFGADLLRADILPVNIIVSNHGDRRYLINPADVLLLKGSSVIDPVPAEIVAATAKAQHGHMTEIAVKQINAFFSDLSLKETVLAPQDRYQGVLFFKTGDRDRRMRYRSDERFFTVLKLFREGSFKAYVAVTDVETGERIHFGPFSLSGM